MQKIGVTNDNILLINALEIKALILQDMVFDIENGDGCDYIVENGLYIFYLFFLYPQMCKCTMTTEIHYEIY